ncbi:MAG: hypothetical protein ABUT20_23150 [Bacteroidota bacterium]
MKIISSFALMILFCSCASGKDKIYTGSTPADRVIRSFLGIPISDSVDFIRWKINMQGDTYSLKCNYGVGKPNTNGFINGGKKIDLNGPLKKDKNYYSILNGDRILKIAELNPSLLYLLDEDNSLLIGNGGWSYTLNIVPVSESDEINIMPKSTLVKDSMAFEGRTPCRGFASIPPGTLCYKLKWHVVFYTDIKTQKPTTYQMNGTAYRSVGAKSGTWEIITGKDNRIIYKLNSEKENAPLYLLKLDENVLIFTDEQGKLLVGDEDFSYTLNRRW